VVTPPRRQCGFSLVALVCAAYERTIAEDSWRSPSQTHRDYLNQLVLWGYTASEVGQILDSGKQSEAGAAAFHLPGVTPPPAT
jgi:ParB family chromosome partitioning protein